LGGPEGTSAPGVDQRDWATGRGAGRVGSRARPAQLVTASRPVRGRGLASSYRRRFAIEPNLDAGRSDASERPRRDGRCWRCRAGRGAVAHGVGDSSARPLASSPSGGKHVANTEAITTAKGWSQRLDAEIGWVLAHEALCQLRLKRAALALDEGKWLLRAFRASTHAHFGFPEFLGVHRAIARSGPARDGREAARG
jgi:hypothetical protein